LRRPLANETLSGHRNRHEWSPNCLWCSDLCGKRPWLRRPATKTLAIVRLATAAQVLVRAEATLGWPPNFPVCGGSASFACFSACRRFAVASKAWLTRHSRSTRILRGSCSRSDSLMIVCCSAVDGPSSRAESSSQVKNSCMRLCNYFPSCSAVLWALTARAALLRRKIDPQSERLPCQKG